MQLLKRNNNELSDLVIMLPMEYSSGDDLVLRYRANVSDNWIDGEIDSFSVECCNWSIRATVNTTLIDDGSYDVSLFVNGVSSTIEEVIIETEGTESVSNYEGVKIIS